MHPDQGEIREALLANKMTWQEALEAITSRKGKPWQTKGWDALRNALLKDHCEQCGCGDPPLVLQHMWQPASFNELCAHVRAPLWELYKQEVAVAIEELEPEERDGCPKCGSTAIRFRKRASADIAWCCAGKKGQRVCGHEFGVPRRVRAYTPEQQRIISTRKQEAYAKRFEDFQVKFGDQIGREAVLISIELHQRYMSGERTKTFCKKCAYLWDVKQQTLCQVCKTNYHTFYETKCSVCDVDRFKLCSRCGRHRHSRKYEVCYECWMGEFE